MHNQKMRYVSQIYSMKDCEVNFEVIPINLVCDAFLLNLYHSPIQYCIELLLYTIKT